MGAQHYLGNPNLKNSNVQLEFSPEQVKELVKCATDPKHFIENYVPKQLKNRSFLGYKSWLWRVTRSN